MTQARVLGVEHFLPPKRLTNEDLIVSYPEWSVEKISSKTGINERRVVESECASDLAVAAAKKLFERQPDWREQTEALIFCTQTPDYLLPTTACLIQDRLGLSTRVAAFDMNLGCSGYIYGLGIAKGLIETDQAAGVLLLNGDTYSRLIHPQDKSVRTLFGDAGTATFLASGQAVDESDVLGPFVYGTDGAGGKNLIVPAGGSRTPAGETTKQIRCDDNGNCRTQENLLMNGAEILTFTLKRVPRLVQETLEKAQLTVDQVDHFVFHQANQFMLESLQKKCKIPREKFFVGMSETGNTVSASIPLALSQLRAQGRLERGARLMLVGFGVGYSWGATLLRWTPSIE